MSSYSYLDLNRHPAVLQDAVDALPSEGMTGPGITPTRMRQGRVPEVQLGFSGSLYGERTLPPPRVHRWSSPVVD